MTGKVNGSHGEGVQAIRAELAPEQKIDLPDEKGNDDSDK